MTVMSRLAEKGILERHKEGRAYVYRPATAQEKLAGSMLRALIGRLYGGSSAHAIAHLIESDEGVDDAELARLEKLIRQKRRRSVAMSTLQQFLLYNLLPGLVAGALSVCFIAGKRSPACASNTWQQVACR